MVFVYKINALDQKVAIAQAVRMSKKLAKYKIINSFNYTIIFYLI